jgi:hypothetical protein
MKKEEEKQKKFEPMKLEFKNLPELPKAEGFKISKAPPIVRSTKHGEEKLDDLKDKKEFSLKDEFDLSNYWGRFRFQFSRINPL